MTDLLVTYSPVSIEGKLAKARLELLLKPDNINAQAIVRSLKQRANVKDLNTAEGLMVASGKLSALSSPFIPMPNPSNISKPVNPDKLLQIYPNPVQHELQFVYSLISQSNLSGGNGVSYSIYDMQGKNILTGNLGPLKAMFGIDVQSLSPGPYTLRVMADDGSSQKAMFIKQ